MFGLTSIFTKKKLKNKLEQTHYEIVHFKTLSSSLFFQLKDIKKILKYLYENI